MTTILLGAAAAALSTMPRAVAARPRAEAPTDPKALMAQFQKDWADFKAAHDEKLNAKVDDALFDEKLKKVDASIDKLEQINVDLGRQIAAAQLGGVGDMAPTDPDYIKAFKAHMRKGTEISAAMTKGTDADGGYLAPVEWDRSITKKLKERSPMRENARVITISTAGFKKLTSDGVVGSGWVGETASRPATSTPQLGSLTFNTGELYANPAISQQLLDDAAVNLEEWLGDEVEVEFARQENIVFISGDGSNKPYGILTYVTGAANAGVHPFGAIGVINTGAAATLTADGFITLMYDLKSAFAANAKLYINRTSLAAVRKLKDGQGNYLWQPTYTVGQPSTLNGAPIVEMPDFPTVAANNIVALYGDMDATYLVVDRVGIRVLRDPFTNKPFVHFYTTKRVGGGVHNPEPMRALKVAA